jgi:hypothetical protein
MSCALSRSFPNCPPCVMFALSRMYSLTHVPKLSAEKYILNIASSSFRQIVWERTCRRSSASSPLLMTIISINKKPTINCQLSIINYQLSIINYQLSIINYQLSIINYQLSIINYQLSIINYQLSIINYQLSIINYQLSIINYQLSIVNCISGFHPKIKKHKAPYVGSLFQGF